MNFSGYHRVLRRLFIFVILLILYLSLYPWHFAPRAVGPGPLTFLLHRWDLGNIYLLTDVAVNIAMYLPLGFTARLALAPHRPAWFGAAVASSAALPLAFSVELLQWYLPTRQPSMSDVAADVAGAAAGALLLTLARAAGRRTSDPAALGLLGVWIAFLLFPFLPPLRSDWVQIRFSTVLHAPVATPYLVVPFAGAWFAGGLLLHAAGVKHVRRWLAVALALIPLQFLVRYRQPLPSELTGAIAGWLIFSVRPLADRAAAFALLAIAAVHDFVPLPGYAPARFSFTPFALLFAGSPQIGLISMASTFYFYGSAIWTLLRSGMSPLLATGIASGLALIDQVLLIPQPDHLPGITTPLLAAAAGAFLLLVDSADSAVNQRTSSSRA